MRSEARRGLGLLVAAAVLAGGAAADTTVTLKQPELYDLLHAGFELPAETRVRIDAVGLSRPDRSGGLRLFGSHEEPFSSYAWILDSATRRTVWVMRDRDAERVGDSDLLLQVEESVELPPGRYELYLFSGLDRVRNLREPGERDRSWWERLWSGTRHSLEEIERDLRDCHVTLTLEDVSREQVGRFEVDGDFADALIRHNRIGDSRFVTTEFVLERPAELRLYSLIERNSDRQPPADYGWITETQTRRVVWHPDRSAFDDAGGGEKNRLVDEKIRLDAGRYTLSYGTDDSHSFDGFNVNPPFDPFNWGITLLPGQEFRAQDFRIVEPEALPAPLIEFVGVGDGEFLEQPFRLERAADLQILALGEFGSHDFVDSGWIVDAATQKTVWEMTEDNTLGAGGAEKNRMFDGIVHLPRGDYVLFYVTDGSHSHERWNAARPFLPDAWGIAVRPAAGLDPSRFARLSADEVADSGDFLVRIVRVGDDERRSERFMLAEPASILILGLGEGTGGEMYDYGTIRDDRGRTVWEMTWDNSEPAGGARKNRRVEDEIRLESGEYEVVYVTDGSHSFQGWNDERPPDPLNWGITLRRVR